MRVKHEILQPLLSWLEKTSVIAFLISVSAYGIYFFDISDELQEEAWREAHPGCRRFWANDFLVNFGYRFFSAELPNAMEVHRYLKVHRFEVLDRIIFTHRPISSQSLSTKS